MGKDLSGYKIYSEVQLWVDKGKGQYMIADAVLVKYDGEIVDDVIVLESKLSGATDYTKRQKQGWKKVSKGEKIEVKATKTSNNGGPELAPKAQLDVKKENVKKISDHGDKEGALEISDVPVDDYNK